MINVLYINYAYKNFDGATYSLMDLIQSVKNKVHPIVLIRKKGCVQDFFISNGIECIICDFEENIYSKPKSKIALIKLIIKYVPWLIRFFIKNKLCVYRVTKILKDRNVKIVHTNNSVLTIGCDMSKKLDAKHVWHFRGFMDLDFGWKTLLGRKNLIKKIRNTDAVIGITKTVLEHFIPIDSKNAYVLYNAVRSMNDVCLSFPKEKYVLFCAAQLSSTKGIEVAIKAFALSKLSMMGYRLRVVGSYNNSFKQTLDQLCYEYGINKCVDFVGPTKNVKSHMEKATAFLMCSQNEGMGRVTVEAMFYGCLVIGRNSGGTKEIIEDGNTGLLFNNISECAILMRKAVLNDYSHIINNAQRYACKNFTKEKYGECLMKIYNSIIS